MHVTNWHEKWNFDENERERERASERVNKRKRQPKNCPNSVKKIFENRNRSKIPMKRRFKSTKLKIKHEIHRNSVHTIIRKISGMVHFFEEKKNSMKQKKTVF